MSELSFKHYKENFCYHDEAIYTWIFEHHREQIKLSKEKFAVRNLKKVFDATFTLEPKIGFQAMSLRDLSSETGLSMGGLYSTIHNKETIAIMVKNVVTMLCVEMGRISRDEKKPEQAIERLVKQSVYTTVLMQPWFHFLYFETRSLPPEHQEGSKQIELTQMTEFEYWIRALKPVDASNHTPDFIATAALTMIQERYLKPWKYKQSVYNVDEYAEQCVQLIFRAAGVLI